MSEWISVDDEMPNYDAIVLLWTEDDMEVVFGKLVKSSQFFKSEHYLSWQQLSGDSGFNPVAAITHWMPLPEPPKTKAP